MEEIQRSGDRTQWYKRLKENNRTGMAKLGLETEKECRGGNTERDT